MVRRIMIRSRPAGQTRHRSRHGASYAMAYRNASGEVPKSRAWDQVTVGTTRVDPGAIR
jgi:hypothetical protein